MTDFHGHLIDSTEIVCVTPVHKDNTGWQFFAVHFRGGSTEMFTGDADLRSKLAGLVRNTEFDHTMVDFNGYLIDLSKVICITSMREIYIGPRPQQAFIVHFRGGSTQSFSKDRDKFVGLVKNAMLDQAMRQSVK